MKIYVDIGNTNIKYLFKDKLDDIKIIKSDIENFKNLLNSYKNFDFVVIITHKEKKIYIEILILKLLQIKILKIILILILI